MNLRNRGRLSLVLFLLSAQTFAAVDVNVYEDAVYVCLDKLHAGGLLKSYMPDQRPLTRHAVAKLAAEARRNAGEGSPFESIIGELERKYSDALLRKSFEFIPLDSFSLSYTATDQKESPVSDNGLGDASGLVQPLLSYNHGDRFGRNSNIYSRSVHKISVGPHFAAYLQPKYFARSGEDADGGIGLHRGYVKVGFKNLEVQAGRDDLRWGPGENGLLFSGNARPLDMIKVSSPEPFRFPGVFKRLGPFRATAFFSWLGGGYHPSHATLSGYRIDYSPFRWWSIGFDHAVFLWGDETQAPDFKTAMRSFIGFISDSAKDRASSNHLMGMDATLRIPQAMGMEIYAKALLEDTQAERAYMLKNDANWLGGLYIPKISGLERLSLRGEYIYTGQFSYRHGIYKDGFAVDGRFIGYDAGPDTHSGSFSSRYQFNLDEFIKIDLRFLQRSQDRYILLFSPSGNNNGIAKDIDSPDERNFIIRMGGQKKLSKMVSLYAEIGYDRKRNADFADDRTANDFSFQIRLDFCPLPFF